MVATGAFLDIHIFLMLKMVYFKYLWLIEVYYERVVN